MKNLTGGVSAWIGARDNIIEGTWTWSVDDSTLRSNKYNKWTGSKYPVAGIKKFYFFCVIKPYAQTKFYHTRQDSQRTPKSQYNNIRYSKHDTHKGENDSVVLVQF